MLLKSPPIVMQDQKKMQCWAAASESWLAANPNRRHYSQDQLVDGLKQDGAVRADGALFKDHGQELWELYLGLRPSRESCGNFSIEKTLKRLQLNYLPLLIGLEVSNEMGHVVVAFGAEIDPANSAESFIVVMDPWSNTNYRKWKLGELQSKTGHITTWQLGKAPLLL
ncbi:MAG: hypothetical protein IPL99_25265 [Candidatus Competibacteraceae bacterium]|nr:hypothetical protein [Candidatus Competibacteraceae bacterium]